MKRPSYRAAIYWLAWNDGGGDPECLDPVHVSEMVSVALVADLFGVPEEKVAQDVVRKRKQEGIGS